MSVSCCLRAVLGMLLLLPVLAIASPQYAYVDFNYLFQGPEDGDGRSLEGAGADLSLRLAENFHLAGGFGRVRESPETRTVGRLALGFNAPVAERTDFVGRIGGLRGERKLTGDGTERENVLLIEAGLRTHVMDDLEFNAMLSHEDFSSAQTWVDLGAVFYLNANLGINALVGFSSDENRYKLGLRLTL